MNQVQNSEIFFGTFLQDILLNEPTTSPELKEVLTNNFLHGENLDIYVKPEYGVIVIKGVHKVVEVKQTVEQPQFIGSFVVADLIRDCVFWDQTAYNKLKLFKNYEVITLVYFPSYKILKMETLDAIKVEYVTGVVWAVN